MKHGKHDSKVSASRPSQAATMSAASAAMASTSSSKMKQDDAQLPRSTFLTLTTRRRLLRKPLPHLPIATPHTKQQIDDTRVDDSRKPVPPTTTEESRKPTTTEEKQDLKRKESSESQASVPGEAMKSADETFTDEKSPMPHTTIFARETTSQRNVLTLEEAKRRTARFQEEERDVLQWWPEPEEGGARRSHDGEIDAPLQLDEASSALLLQIVDYSLHTTLALGDAERTQAADAILAAVHSSIGDITRPEILRELQKTASIMWRVDAIARSAEQAQGKGAPAAATMLGALGARFPRLTPWRGLGFREGPSATTTPMWSPNPQLEDANEFPFQEKPRSSGMASPAYGTEARRRKRDVFAQVFANAPWTSGPGAGDGSSLAPSAAPESSHRPKAGDGVKTSKSPGSAALPKLLARQAEPTIAVTGTTHADDAATPTESDTSLDDSASTLSLQDSAKGVADEPTTTGAHPSALTDRLFRQLKSDAERVEAASKKAPERSTSVSPAGALSRSSSASTLGVERIRAATQVTNCKVCVSFDSGARSHGEEAAETPQGSRRGTISALDTVKSDRTVKEAGVQDGENGFIVEWRKGIFDGIPLGLNPLSVDVESRGLDETSEAVLNAGGTFVVGGCDEDHRESILKIFEVVFYAACAILLERSFLQDLEAFSGDGGAIMPEHISTVAEDIFEVVQDENKDTSGPDVQSLQSLATPRHAHWSRGIWGMLGGQGHHPSPKRETAEKKLRNIGAGMRRTTTIESTGSSSNDQPISTMAPKRRMGSGAHLAPYAKWGKHLFSSVYKRAGSNADNNGTRARASTDLEDGLAARLRSDSSKSIRQILAASKKVRPLSARPLCISPYRRATVPAEKSPDFLKSLLAQQHAIFTIMEGSDAALPFAQDAKDPTALAADVLKWPPSSMRKRPFLPERQGSSMSVSSSVLTMSSRFVSASQLLSANEQSRATSTLQNDEDVRRDLTFYQHVGGSRDLSLGQAIEELAAKAESLSLEASRTRAGKDAKVQKPDPASQTTTIAQYLHGNNKIIACATILSKEEQVRGDDTALSRKGSASDGDKRAPTPSAVGAASSDVGTEQTTDVLHSLLAPPTEAERKSSPSGPSSAFQSRIVMWQADMLNDRQSVETSMSHASYLFSFSAYLNALVSHPMLHDKSALRMRESDRSAGNATYKHIISVFRLGRVMLKFDVRPLVVFDIFVDGPVVSKDPRQSARLTSSNDQQESILLVELRSDIGAFFASVGRKVEELKSIIELRNDKGDHLETQKEAKGTGHVGESVSTTSTISSPSFIEGRLRQESQTAGTSKHDLERPLDTLERLRGSLDGAEASLGDTLKDTEDERINDVRYRFSQRGRNIKAHITAWMHKHLTKEEIDKYGHLETTEPDYFRKGTYAFPGSRFLIRTEEPLSIIAYSLSSRDFHNELEKSQRTADVLDWRSRVMSDDALHKQGASSPESLLSEVDDSALLKPLQVSMKRKKHNKDAGFLSMRIRSGQHLNFSVGLPGEARDGDNEASSTPLREDADATPVQSCIYPVSGNENFDTLGTEGSPFRAHVSAFTPQESLKEMFPGDDSRDDSTIASNDGSIRLGRSPSFLRASGIVSEARSSSFADDTAAPLQNASTMTVKPTGSSATSSPKQPIPSASSSPRGPASPHIKHILRVGNVKISCVSWFAEDFAKLRARWGVEEDFIASLSRSKAWASAGGKSKSGFYITSDGKWIAKQLLNVWTVDEKEAFLDFAPSYLRHMMGSLDRDCPTLLVKIAGVYSVKIKDVKTGELKVRLSVQLLENVFAGDDGRTLKFDLKGIRERRVAAAKAQQQAQAAAEARPSQAPASVWWDGEWLDAIQPRAFVPEDDLAHFRRALRNDLAFLMAANVMDYSLLVGLHEPGEDEDADASSTPWIRTRIVDFLGAWTLVKQLESSGKKAIKSQKPTVIPPQEYAARFRETIETYFIGCPPAQ